MNNHVIGGKTPQQALDSLHNMTADVSAIEETEYRARLVKAQTYMQQHEIAAIYLNAGTNLAYFTGTHWGASERLVGAILPAYGEVQYLVPIFEIATLQEYMSVTGPVHGWHEHECPYELFTKVLAQLHITTHAKIAMDESSPFFIFDGINQLQSGHTIVNGKAVTAHCRMTKSPHELTLIQRAMDMTLEVHKAVASILYAGISTLEVAQFINQAHQKVGASGSYFCIVLFGEATAYPHGVKNPQLLQDGDMVLVDTGCKLQGYTSDITRTYVYGQASQRQRQRQVWQYEKQAQAAAFNAAQLGVTCEDVDNAARQSLEANGLGPGYAIPGLPHRTGHGIGMDIHEWPYLVGGNLQPLEAGMCFSNEPMICIPGEFGVRLEDHFYITEQGPRWFTQPSHNIDNPFG